MIRSLALLSVLATTALLPPRAFFQDPSAAPGAEHARLGKLAGDWTVATTFSFQGHAPQVFQGTARARAILGGRFVQFDETGVEFGEKVERQKTWAFNNAAKQYESTWIYTGSTAVMRLAGTMGNDGKKIAGDASFAGDHGEAQQFTWDLQLLDDDHFATTLVAPSHGDRPAATFTAVYARAPQK
jgi:hypothetical protein